MRKTEDVIGVQPRGLKIVSIPKTDFEPIHIRLLQVDTAQGVERLVADMTVEEAKDLSIALKLHVMEARGTVATAEQEVEALAALARASLKASGGNGIRGGGGGGGDGGGEGGWPPA